MALSESDGPRNRGYSQIYRGAVQVLNITQQSGSCRVLPILTYLTSVPHQTVHPSYTEQIELSFAIVILS